jgi:cytochrome c oxidase subunit 2
MRLTLVAHPEDEYEQWLYAQREEASTPSTPLEQQGREVMLSKPCVLCHTVRGTPARGTVGPDLTHLASRRMIAANSLRLNTANLAAWVTHAQSLKPESGMPNLTQFSGEELRALVAYLRQLE